MRFSSSDFGLQILKYQKASRAATIYIYVYICIFLLETWYLSNSKIRRGGVVCVDRSLHDVSAGEGPGCVMFWCAHVYEVAMISRLLKITGLFCRIWSLL